MRPKYTGETNLCTAIILLCTNLHNKLAHQNLCTNFHKKKPKKGPKYFLPTWRATLVSSTSASRQRHRPATQPHWTSSCPTWDALTGSLLIQHQHPLDTLLFVTSACFAKVVRAPPPHHWRKSTHQIIAFESHVKRGAYGYLYIPINQAAVTVWIMEGDWTRCDCKMFPTSAVTVSHNRDK